MSTEPAKPPQLTQTWLVKNEVKSVWSYLHAPERTPEEKKLATRLLQKLVIERPGAAKLVNQLQERRKEIECSRTKTTTSVRPPKSKPNNSVSTTHGRDSGSTPKTTTPNFGMDDTMNRYERDAEDEAQLAAWQRSLPPVPRWQQDMAAEQAEASARLNDPMAKSWLNDVDADPVWGGPNRSGAYTSRAKQDADKERRDEAAQRRASESGIRQGAPRDYHAEQQYDQELEQAQRDIETRQNNAEFFRRAAEQGFTGRR